MSLSAGIPIQQFKLRRIFRNLRNLVGLIYASLTVSLYV